MWMCGGGDRRSGGSFWMGGSGGGAGGSLVGDELGEELVKICILLHNLIVLLTKECILLFKMVKLVVVGMDDKSVSGGWSG